MLPPIQRLAACAALTATSSLPTQAAQTLTGAMQLRFAPGAALDSVRRRRLLCPCLALPLDFASTYAHLHTQRPL